MIAAQHAGPPSADVIALVDSSWDVVVVGAGPAGAGAAMQLAQRGARVLIVDRARFPRSKVCGCYLNPSAVAALEAIGSLVHVLDAGARPVRRMEWSIGRTRLRFELRGGLALSRSRLDTALVLRAIAAGATFADGVVASPAGLTAAARNVHLRSARGAATVTARVVIAADGVGGRFADHEPGCEARVASGARIGIGATVRCAAASYEPGVIYMTCGPQAYMGMLRVEDDAMPLAAAVDPRWLRRVGGPASAAARLLRAGGLPPVNAADADWRGTPALTRRRRSRAADRLLVIGDSAGYVEPFTGEGMSWALAAAQAVVAPAADAIVRWRPGVASTWNRWHRQALAPRQVACRCVALLLRHTALLAAAGRALQLTPRVLTAFVRAMQAPADPRRSAAFCDAVLA